MINECLKTIVASDYNAEFLVNGTLLSGSVIYTNIMEPTKFVMLCRNCSSNVVYSIHKFDRNYREIDCEEFSNFVDFAKAIDVNHLRYNPLMNAELVDEAKKLYQKLNLNNLKETV